MAFLPGGSGGGKNFPQVYCVGVTEKEEKKGVRFTDDVIFEQGKKGLFQLVVFIDGVLDLHRIQPLLNDIECVSGGMLGAAETTFFLKTTKMIQTSWTLPTQPSNVYRLATGHFAKGVQSRSTMSRIVYGGSRVASNLLSCGLIALFLLLARMCLS